MRVSHLAAVGALLLPLCALAGIESITASDSVAALKTALSQGTTHAIESLGVVDGFLKNPEVKIPLPPTLQKAESVMRLFGMGDQADALVVAMNRAAEAAVPEAKSLLVGAVQQMSLVDARQILTGGDDAATQYFRKVSYDKLEQKFLPIVKQTTDKVALSQQYNHFVGQAAQYGLVDTKDANVEGFLFKSMSGAEKRPFFRQQNSLPFRASIEAVLINIVRYRRRKQVADGTTGSQQRPDTGGRDIQIGLFQGDHPRAAPV